MTHDLTRQHRAALPAPGIWALHRSSIITLASRSDQERVAVSAGTLVVVADAPQRSSLTIVARSTDRQVLLFAADVAIDADSRALSRWRFSGSVVDGAVRHPLHMTLSYHGVHRLRENVWAWFTGSATTELGRRGLRGGRPELALELDLLFDAPPMAGVIAEAGNGASSMAA